MCKHYDFVKWAHKQKGCKKAVTRDGSDGYGPFYSHAKCIHDERKSELSDLFELSSEVEISQDKDVIEFQRDKIYKLECEVRNLMENMSLLAKNQVVKK